MSFKSFLKIAALTVTAAVLLTGCGTVENWAKANRIHKVSDQIAEYTLPQGYREQFGVDVLGYQMVGLEGESPSCHIYLIQASEGSDADTESLQAAAKSMGASGEDTTTGYVETREAVIRGQAQPLVVSEGVNSENQPYRQVTAAFEGKNGPALLSISVPIDLWDWELVESFITSLS